MAAFLGGVTEPVSCFAHELMRDLLTGLVIFKGECVKRMYPVTGQSGLWILL